MTNIRIYSDVGFENRYEIYFDGHAGTGPNNIVCAAVSILAASFADWCRAMHKTGRLKEFQMSPEDMSGDTGTLYIFSEAKPGAKDELIGASSMLTGGLFMIQEQYPDLISIEMKEFPLKDIPD